MLRTIEPKDYDHMLNELQKALAQKRECFCIVEEIIWAHTTKINEKRYRRKQDYRITKNNLIIKGGERG